MKKKSIGNLNLMNIKQIVRPQLTNLKGGSEGGYNVGDLDTESGFGD